MKNFIFQPTVSSSCSYFSGEHKESQKLSAVVSCVMVSDEEIMYG